MAVIDTLTQRNAAFASSRFSADLKIIPSMKTMIIGCVDPRVDPADIFGLAPGEAVVIRNVGGRITPATLQTMAMLRIVAKASGGDIGLGWNLIVLHHTDCGITRLAHSPELLAKHFGVTPEDLDGLAIADPHKAVAIDVAALKSNPLLPGGFLVTGLVYDVTTGRVEIAVLPALLRPEIPA
jgi:carbonic anhydrase